MITYERLFSDGGCFVGFTVYVDGEHFETCDIADLHNTIERAERSMK